MLTMVLLSFRLDNNENVEDIVAEDSYLIQKLISIEQGNNWNTIIGPDNWLFKVLNDKHSPFNRNQLCKFHYFHIPGADTQMAVWARKDLPYQVGQIDLRISDGPKVLKRSHLCK